MKYVYLFTLFLFSYIQLYAQAPRVFVLDANRLLSIREKIKEKDPQTLLLVDSLRREADALLSMKPVSVMDKLLTPVSGDKHDYMSQAPYFWYDSSKADGLPYIRKDGLRNPEIYKITDRSNLGKLENACRILSLAWWLTGQEIYAKKSASLLNTWFLGEDTKMNPHLNYGQAIPGINTGRGIGIIETIALIHIADAASLLTNSEAWSRTDHKALQNWYSAYLEWMLTSKNGTDEKATKNNHGTWYNVQVVDFALFTGDMKKAKQLAQESTKRIDGQISADGKMPLELDRTNGLGYTTMNLNGWFIMARLASKTGIDLWQYKNPEHAGIATALDWILPYALGRKDWIYEQIGKYNRKEMYPLLLQAAKATGNMDYLKEAMQLQKEGINWLDDLLYRF